jgi:hypothetical protein
MLEVTTVITVKDLPAAALKSIRQATQGATLKRIERIEINYEIQDGRAVKLDAPVTHYAVEYTRAEKTTEIVVAPDGTEIE